MSETMWDVVTCLFVLSGAFTVTGELVRASNPIELSPASVVVKYGDPVSVNCSASSNESEGMGWEAPYGGQAFQKNAKFVIWSVASLKDWTIIPTCYITIRDYNQFRLKLPVTLYKTPDSVSISQSDFTGPMVAGRIYQLRCDFTNVAPLRELSVTWYRGNEIIHNHSYDKEIATPQNDTSVLTITARKEDNGARVLCRTQLNLGSSGPNPPPVVTSEPYHVIVQYPPVFLSPEPEALDLAVDAVKMLNCSAVGNPEPVYSWLASHPTALEVENEAVFSPASLLPGTYTCTASNHLGSRIKTFTVTETQSSRHGLTAGIVVAVLVVFGLVLAGVIYHRQTNPWDRTTFSAIVGPLGALAVLLFGATVLGTSKGFLV